jgi:hypothetical protein
LLVVVEQQPQIEAAAEIQVVLRQPNPQVAVAVEQKRFLQLQVQTVVLAVEQVVRLREQVELVTRQSRVQVKEITVAILPETTQVAVAVEQVQMELHQQQPWVEMVVAVQHHQLLDHQLLMVAVVAVDSMPREHAEPAVQAAVAHLQRFEKQMETRELRTQAVEDRVQMVVAQQYLVAVQVVLELLSFNIQTPEPYRSELV